MRLLSILLLGLPLAAFANDFTDAVKESFEENKRKPNFNAEELFLHPGAVQIGDAFDVPLYSGDPNDPVSYVEVRLLDDESEERFLFAVDPALSLVAVSEGFAAKAGGEPKDVRVKHATGFTTKVAKLDGFRIGEATFGEIMVVADFASGSTVPIDGVIGLAAFPDLAVALTPSQGTLTLAPVSEASKALGKVKGVQLPYTVQEYSEHEFDKHTEWLNERLSMIIEGTYGGQAVSVALSDRGLGSYASSGRGAITSDKVGALTPSIYVNNGATYSEALALGGLKMGHVPAAPIHSQSYTQQAWSMALSADVTSHYDIAVDPSSKLVVMSAVSSVKRASWWDYVIEQANKGLEPDEETGEAPKAEAVAGTYSELAGIYNRMGKEDKRLEAAQKALDSAPDDCSKHLGVGEAYAQAGRFADAAPHLRAAGEMWDSWDELPIKERQQIGEEKAEAEADELAWTGPIPQSGSCYVAWGQLAAAELAQGKPDDAIRLYDEHFDLDYELALVAGNAWLSKGNVQKAEAAYRQAMRVSDTALTRSGLAVAQAERGQASQAAPNFLNRVVQSFEPVSALRAWQTTLRINQGPETALEATRALAERMPQNPYFQLALAEASVAAGAEPAAALLAAIQVFEYELVVFSDSSDLWAGYAAALMHAGRAEEAKAAAERAIRHNHLQVDAYLTLGSLAEASGDGAKAKEWREKALAFGVTDPTVAWTLSKL